MVFTLSKFNTTNCNTLNSVVKYEMIFEYNISLAYILVCLQIYEN